MNLEALVMYFFIGLTAISGLGVLLIRNVFKAALSLLVCLLGLAALYVLSFAEFVAVAQILVYAGGVVVLILFGVMLTTKISGKALAAGYGNVASGVLLMIGLLWLLTPLLQDLPHATPATTPTAVVSDIESIGTLLMTWYALPFEVTGIILLLALVGAAVSGTTKSTEPDA